jgi:hypothetical protein
MWEGRRRGINGAAIEVLIDGGVDLRGGLASRPSMKSQTGCEPSLER